jgi:hypothetical protein
MLFYLNAEIYERSYVLQIKLWGCLHDVVYIIGNDQSRQFLLRILVTAKNGNSLFEITVTQQWMPDMFT